MQHNFKPTKGDPAKSREVPLIRFVYLLPLVALMLVPAPARAQSACEGDAFRLCGTFIPNVAQVKSCLVRNKKKVSTSCRREMGGR